MDQYISFIAETYLVPSQIKVITIIQVIIISVISQQFDFYLFKMPL